MRFPLHHTEAMGFFVLNRKFVYFSIGITHARKYESHISWMQLLQVTLDMQNTIVTTLHLDFLF